MVKPQISSGKEQRLVFELESTLYSIVYVQIDKVYMPEINEGRIKGCVPLAKFYGIDYVEGCWQRPDSESLLLLLDLRMMLGLKKMPYDSRTRICSLYDKPLKPFGLILIGTIDTISEDDKTLSGRIIAKIDPLELIKVPSLDSDDSK